MQELLGTLIGEGAFRRVYQHVMFPSLVIKVARDDLKCDYAGCEDNYIESEIWKMATDEEKESFAPVEDISHNGKYLIMGRTTPIEDMTDFYMKYIEASIPYYAQMDVHYDNVGMFDGRPVIHDYAMIRWEAISSRDSAVNILKTLKSGRSVFDPDKQKNQYEKLAAAL